jgi:lipopolysaccharide/colanic/teichoic acid biosynthesis glycosyltransferase
LSSERYFQAKFVAEWCFALVMFIVTSPLLLLLAVLVKATSTGPAFYAQTRLGRHGRTYRILKLRSMVKNAEAGTGPVWAAQGDSRITAIGRILRMTHLDELPQLWNVLRGEMGLIGPRPERPEIAKRIERQVADFRLRLQVRPGITGLAQMLLPADDPNDVEMHGLRRKLSHDLYYISNAGFLMDLRIALSTPCYFLAAAIRAMHEGFVKAYGAMADAESGHDDAAQDSTDAPKANHQHANSSRHAASAGGWSEGGRGLMLVSRMSNEQAGPITQ